MEAQSPRERLLQTIMPLLDHRSLTLVMWLSLLDRRRHGFVLILCLLDDSLHGGGEFQCGR
jgi:hypothetical protein